LERQIAEMSEKECKMQNEIIDLKKEVHLFAAVKSLINNK
jgi:hypothetical protein